jgi:hypothetical protein
MAHSQPEAYGMEEAWCRPFCRKMIAWMFEPTQSHPAFGQVHDPGKF